MPLKGLDKNIFVTLKCLNFSAGGGKKQGAAERRAEAAIQKSQAQELGVPVKKRNPAKKKGGASKGGLLNKKNKAAFELGGASIADMESGNQVSTNASKEMQVKSKEDKKQFKKEDAAEE